MGQHQAVVERTMKDNNMAGGDRRSRHWNSRHTLLFSYIHLVIHRKKSHSVHSSLFASSVVTSPVIHAA